MHISSEQRPRSHVKDMENGTKAFLKLKSLYETTDLATTDLAVEEICSKSLADFKNVGGWAEHLRKWENEINAAGESLPAWFMGSRFRMGLTRNLNSYMFHLTHGAKLRGTVLTIDEMVKALIDQDKRDIHMEESRNSARTAKNSRNRPTKPSKNDGSKDKDKSKKDRDTGPCEVCESPTHDKPHCFYHNKSQRTPDWKPYETKMHLAVDWPDKTNFVPANKTDKAKEDDKIKRVKSDDPTVSAPKSDSPIEDSTSSDSEDSTSSITSSRHSAMGRARRIRSSNLIFQTNCAARIARSTISSRDPNFFLDSGADTHLCYNKKLFHELKPLATAKTVEVADNALLAVKGIESIILELNIDGKRVCNTITGVEYVPDLEFNLISTGTLEKKSCEVVAKQGRLRIIDENDDKVFMTGTRQKEKKSNSYTLDM